MGRTVPEMGSVMEAVSLHSNSSRQPHLCKFYNNKKKYRRNLKPVSRVLEESQTVGVVVDCLQSPLFGSIEQASICFVLLQVQSGEIAKNPRCPLPHAIHPENYGPLFSGYT